MVTSALVSLLPSNLLFAATDQLLITSDSTYQMNIGTTFTVSVKAFISSADENQTAIGHVKYPVGQLKYVSAQPNGSGFGNPEITPLSGGLIKFEASRESTGKGVVKIFDITFQAVGPGTAIVEFTGDSKVNGAATNYKSSVFSITNPAPAPRPTTSTAPKPASPAPVTVAPIPVPVTPPISSPSESPNPNIPVLDPNGVVTGVDIEPDYNKAIITWKVDADNPESVIMYGLKSSSVNQRVTYTKEPDGSFKAIIANLQPGVRYYFTITGAGGDGKQGTYSSTLSTNGYPARITITENNIPAKGAQIRINNMTKIADADGKATIGLAEGEYKGTITTSTASLEISLKINKKTIPDDGSAPPAQSFSFNLTSSPLEQGPGSGAAILTFVGILIGGTAILGLGFFGFVTYRRKKFETQYGNTPSTTVIIDDGYNWHDQDSTQAENMSPKISPNGIPAIRHRNNSVYIDDEEPEDMFEKKN